MSAIDEHAVRILAALAERPRGADTFVSGEDLAATTGLAPHEIDDAVAILVDGGLLHWIQAMGTAPYNFRAVELTPQGRHQYAKSLERVRMPELHDLVALRKPNGSVFLDIHANVQPDLILIGDGRLPLEENDILTRRLPNGLEERYLVLDRGFSSKGVGRLGAHYQARVRRESAVSPAPAPMIIYNLHGNSRINIGSQDSSMNVINATPDELFARLRQVVEQGIADIATRTRILDHVTRLEQAKGTETYSAQYIAFIAAVADHMALLVPFIPALTQLLQQFMSR